ncbi:MAG TPA: pyrimidine/purine nucleoside phosphorylase [Candidatus Hydrogenedentes bacterium]|nr:pyrimidine/purine nucleoside phosphorylase [Candidatus Hydrogenedentota bacterium]HQN02074.1 pyrimidine/purine nucleoside phosphorylase [Candidatus Hydrogenedentota bacterium]
MQLPEQFENVTVHCKANIYFEGKVASHTLQFPDGSKKTIGLIYPGTYHFNTNAPERMEITAGTCTIQLAGSTEEMTYATGTFFDVPGNSGFDIHVDNGIAEYICSYL